MTGKINHLITIAAMLIVCFAGTVFAQQTRDRKITDWCGAETGLNGLYRIDFERSDRLYSVIEGASSSVPFGEQQQFFIDLSVRLAPPDMLAIECRDNRVSLASSRAARVEFLADGKTRSLQTSGGGAVQTRIWLDRRSGLMFSSSGGSDTLNFNFLPIDNGRALRVTRRIAAKELIAPVVIQTIYNKVSTVASWDIFGDSTLASQSREQKPDTTSQNPLTQLSKILPNNDVHNLRETLAEWIAATNRRDIEKQMSFYMGRLKAFYLTRNVSINAVRSEKNRAFSAATSIDISAAEPEIIFQNEGREAVMRFRKMYDIQTRAKSRRGEVVQELRWQRTANGWKIYSERDIRIIR